MRSIRISLLVWLIAWQLLAALLLAMSTYAHTLARMNELHDAELRQVALTAMLHYGTHAEAQATDKAPKLPPAGLTLMVQVWSKDGQLVHGSGGNFDPSAWFAPSTGYATRTLGDHRWRVYTHEGEDGLLFQAAQDLEQREEIAFDIALKMLIPSVMIVLLISAVLTYALNHNLRPLAATSQEIERRSATSLEAIDFADLPEEILPLVESINALMQRLDTALAAQRQFTADAAHELRTPLTALRLQLRLLGSAHDEAEREAAMADMRGGIDRATRQVEQLLALSRLEPEAVISHDVRVDLNGLVRSVVADFNLRAQSDGIDLGADLPEQTCAAQGSPDQLKVLLNNLVDNALRYTRRGGHVDVRLAIDPGSGEPILEVIDDGPGIEMWERHRVFDRFYRAASSQTEEQTIDGTGLGMAIVKSIAEHHGASVTLGDGLPGGRGPGLSVQVRFPAPPSAPG